MNGTDCTVWDGGPGVGNVHSWAALGEGVPASVLAATVLRLTDGSRLWVMGTRAGARSSLSLLSSAPASSSRRRPRHRARRVALAAASSLLATAHSPATLRPPTPADCTLTVPAAPEQLSHLVSHPLSCIPSAFPARGRPTRRASSLYHLAPVPRPVPLVPCLWARHRTAAPPPSPARARPTTQRGLLALIRTLRHDSKGQPPGPAPCTPQPRLLGLLGPAHPVRQPQVRRDPLLRP